MKYARISITSISISCKRKLIKLSDSFICIPTCKRQINAEGSMNVLGWLGYGVPGIKVRNWIIWMYPELSNGWSIQYVQKVYSNASCLIQGILIDNHENIDMTSKMSTMITNRSILIKYLVSMHHIAPKHYHNIPFLWHYIWHTFYYHFITTTIYASNLVSF